MISSPFSEVNYLLWSIQYNTIQNLLATKHSVMFMANKVFKWEVFLSIYTVKDHHVKYSSPINEYLNSLHAGY